MISDKKHGYYTLDTGSASFVEEMDGMPEVLKSIISSVESQIPHSTARAFVIDATPKSVTIEKNIRKSSTRPIISSESKSINPQRKTGSFWKRILRSLSEMTSKLFCDHDWKPDYEAYGWGKNGEATAQNPAPCVLPPSFINLKICSKCGKKK